MHSGSTAAVGFKQHVLSLFFQDVHKIEPNNYAWRRFSHDGVDRSGLIDIGKHALYLDWFVTNYDDVYRAFERLADPESKRLFIDILRFKLSGHLHVRIGSRIPHLAAEAERFEAAFSGAASALGGSGIFGALVHYDQDWNGVRYAVDTIPGGLNFLLVYRQYYFSRDGVTIEPEPGDHVIDGGAFTGESTVVFAKSVGPEGRVYAFDPVQNHIDVCHHNIAQLDTANVTMFAYGLSDRSADAPPVQLDQYAPGWRAGDDAVPLRRIDDLVIDGAIERIDFLKLDVEGSELAALQGSQAALHAFRPKLAISIYHKPDDFFQICNYLAGLQLGYVFYLDHYTIHDEETVLYAVAR